MLFKNAQVIYDYDKDILRIRNCQARNKCTEEIQGNYGFTSYRDITGTPCMIELPELSLFLKTDKQFLRDFTYYDLT